MKLQFQIGEEAPGVYPASRLASQLVIISRRLLPPPPYLLRVMLPLAARANPLYSEIQAYYPWYGFHGPSYRLVHPVLPCQ